MYEGLKSMESEDDYAQQRKEQFARMASSESSGNTQDYGVELSTLSNVISNDELDKMEESLSVGHSQQVNQQTVVGPSSTSVALTDILSEVDVELGKDKRGVLPQPRPDIDFDDHKLERRASNG